MQDLITRLRNYRDEDGVSCGAALEAADMLERMSIAPTSLTKTEREQIAEILKRRANEIAGYNGEYVRDDKHYGSVSLALSRETERLRRLAERVCPPEPEDDDA